MKAGQITFVGILAAALVAGGYLLYLASRALPLPGGKLLVMAPYLALAMSVAKRELSTPWTMTLVSLVLGVLLSVFTPLMGASILATGVLSDASARLIPWRASSSLRIILSAAVYPAWGLAIWLAISNYLTGNLLLDTFGYGPLLAAVALAYLLGVGGALMGLKIASRLRMGGRFPGGGR